MSIDMCVLARSQRAAYILPALTGGGLPHLSDTAHFDMSAGQRLCVWAGLSAKGWWQGRGTHCNGCLTLRAWTAITSSVKE